MFSTISLDELTAVIQHSVEKAISNFKEPDRIKEPDRRIYGIIGLADFLQCSKPTAVKIGRSGKFPRYQEGHKIFFLESEVLRGLSK